MKKVLIIDDDARNIFALKAVLKSKGYDCLSVTDARDGIGMLKDDAHGIGIVLLDMMMPDMDGYEALPIIREQAGQLPVIAVTAQAMAGDREKCLAAGADDYVSKPVNIDVLIPILDRHLKN